MENNIEDLRHIRSMMERSTKFLSLSGISGILAGSFALLGAFLAYMVLYSGTLVITPWIVVDMILIAVFVLFAAASSGVYFSMRKAKKQGAKFWSNTTVMIMKDAGVPLFAGGVFSLILVYHNCSYLVASAMLVFCGVALINAGARTYRDVKILGTSLIAIGVLAGIFSQYGLFFWALGFGVMFIIYGIVMYYKYDMKSNKAN